VSDQTRREAREDFGIFRLLQPAFLQVIIVVETDAQNLRRYGHRRQQPDSVQVDCRRLPEASADAQQVCTLCDQLGQSAGKSAVALREATPARAFIHGNSGDPTCFEIDDAHELPAVRAVEPRCRENQCANVAAHSAGTSVVSLKSALKGAARHITLSGYALRCLPSAALPVSEAAVRQFIVDHAQRYDAEGRLVNELPDVPDQALGAGWLRGEARSAGAEHSRAPRGGAVRVGRRADGRPAGG